MRYAEDTEPKRKREEYTDAPDLPDDLRDRVFRGIADRAVAAVEAHADRDEALAEYLDMLSRTVVPAGDARWRGACEIVDPLVLEQFMGLFASVRAATAQRPFWSVKARSAELEPIAQSFSKWLEETSELDGLDAALYSRDYIALRDGMAALHACWEEYGEWTMRQRYMNEDGEEAETPVELPVGTGVYPLGTARSFVNYRQGIRWKVVDRADLYTVPANCADPERAEAVFHRVWMTAHELLRGVSYYGFDQDEVDRLLELGPTHDGRDTSYHEALESVMGTECAEGVYEVFMEYGYVPLVRGEDSNAVEKRLRPYYGLRFQTIHCPRHRSILRWRFWPHDRLPYVFAWMLRTPNTMDGESVPSIVGPFQEEATANVRLYYDAANLVLSPMFRVKETSLKEFGYPEAYPGAVLPYRTDPREVEPMPFNLGGLQIGLQTVEHPLSRARQALSGETTVKMDDRVRKATEVQASMQGMSMKFSLVLANIQSSMLDVLKLMIALYRDNGKLPPEFLSISLDDYSIVPRAVSQNSNPVIRLANAQTAMAMLRSSPLYQQALQRGDFRPEYHLLMEALSAVSLDNITQLIGDEPPAPPPPSAELLAQEAMSRQSAAQPQEPVLQEGPDPMQQLGLLGLLANQGANEAPAIEGDLG